MARTEPAFSNLQRSITTSSQEVSSKRTLTPPLPLLKKRQSETLKYCGPINRKTLPRCLLQQSLKDQFLTVT